MKPHRRIIATVADGGFTALALGGGLHPNANPARHGLERLDGLSYGEGVRRVDVYRPLERSGPLPVVLYLHGGGFQQLSRRTHWLMAMAFARQGMVVFSADYRLAPRHPFPAAHEDACAALLWVHQHAAEYGGDPSRLVLAGDSAGGNLVASLAVACSWQRPEAFASQLFDAGVRPGAVVAKYGLFQLSDSARFARRRKLPWVVHQRIVDVEDCYLPGGAHDLADPLLVIEGDAEPDRPLPAFFLPVGTADPLLDDTRRLHAALVRRGVISEAQYYPGEMHGFTGFIWREGARKAWRDAFRFLKTQDLVSTDDVKPVFA
jgi:acetyl esterase